MSKRLTLINELAQQMDDPTTRKQPNRAEAENIVGVIITMYEGQVFKRLLESMTDEEFENLLT